MRLVLTPRDATGRIAVEFSAFLEFSLDLEIQLEALVDRYEAAQRRVERPA